MEKSKCLVNLKHKEILWQPQHITLRLLTKEYNQADKGKKFKGGGMMDKKDMAQDKKMAKKAVGMHEKQLHGGKKSNLAALKKGGKVKKMAKGGCYAKGGGIEKKGKTKGKII